MRERLYRIKQPVWKWSRRHSRKWGRVVYASNGYEVFKDSGTWWLMGPDNSQDEFDSCTAAKMGAETHFEDERSSVIDRYMEQAYDEREP